MAEVSARLPNVEVAIIPQATEVWDVPLHTFVIYDERMVEIELFAGEVVFRDPKRRCLSPQHLLSSSGGMLSLGMTLTTFFSPSLMSLCESLTEASFLCVTLLISCS